MEALDALGKLLLDWQYLQLLLAGLVVGLVLGALPSMVIPGLAIALSASFFLEPAAAVVLMASIMGPTAVGGSIPSILMGVPGEPVNAATVFDGYPMARRGEAGRAIGIAATASGLGGLLGLGFLILLLPFMKSLVMAFGPPEIFMLILVGLYTIVIAARADIVKGLLSGALGMCLSFIGYSTVGGTYRFSFGSDIYMYDGLPIVAFFIGLFAISEVLRMHESRHDLPPPIAPSGYGHVGTGVMDVLRNPVCLIRSSAVGAGIGLIPGVGGAVANFVAYAVTKNASREPETFGTGNPKGIISSEAGTDAKDGGALVPTLAFGIPGSTTMALFLGALTMHGFAVGPTFLTRHLDVVWLLIVTLIVSNILGSLVALVAAPWLARVVSVPKPYLIIVILVLSLFGVLISRNSVLDVFQAILWGVLGYFLVRKGFSMVPLVIGFILGPRAESAYIQSLQISGGDYSVFLRSSAISVGLFALFLALVVSSVVSGWRRSRASRRMTGLSA